MITAPSILAVLEIFLFDVLWTAVTAVAYVFWYLSFRTKGKASQDHLGRAMLLSLAGLFLVMIDMEMH
jgi:hypothetical protein